MSRLTSFGLTLALAAAASTAIAATPMPLGPCQVGAIRLHTGAKGSEVLAQVRRAFPRATLAMQPYAGGQIRTEVREGSERLMYVFSSKTGDALIEIDLLAPRFQVAPGVFPGASLQSAQRTLGQASLEVNPTDSTEVLTFADPNHVLAGLSATGCTVNAVAGPGARVGLYKHGESDTHRFGPGAVIARVDIAP